jgi:hypothetical protein
MANSSVRGGVFATWSDPLGNVVHSLNRDGTHNLSGVNFADGTSMATAAQNLAGVSSDPIAGVVVSPSLPLTFGGVTMPTGDPDLGDVLTITNALTVPQQAGWVAPAGAKVTKAQRVAVGVIASATPSAIISMPWTVPFADNNYTVVGSVAVAETPSDGAATAICCIGMLQYQAGGAGINFVVCNADGVSHNVVATFIAIHD